MTQHWSKMSERSVKAFWSYHLDKPWPHNDGKCEFLFYLLNLIKNLIYLDLERMSDNQLNYSGIPFSTDTDQSPIGGQLYQYRHYNIIQIGCYVFFFYKDTLHKHNLAVGGALDIWRHDRAIHRHQREPEVAKMSDLFSVWGDKSSNKSRDNCLPVCYQLSQTISTSLSNPRETGISVNQYGVVGR